MIETTKECMPGHHLYVSRLNLLRGWRKIKDDETEIKLMKVSVLANCIDTSCPEHHRRIYIDIGSVPNAQQLLQAKSRLAPLRPSSRRQNKAEWRRWRRKFIAH